MYRRISYICSILYELSLRQINCYMRIHLTYGNLVETYAKSHNQREQVHFVHSPCMFYSIGIEHWNGCKHNNSCKSCCWDIFECWCEKLSCNDNTETSYNATSWSLNSWLSVYSSTRKTSSDGVTKNSILIKVWNASTAGPAAWLRFEEKFE